MRRVDRAHQPQWGQSLVDLDSSDGLDDFAYLFSSFSLIFTSSSFPVISFLTRTSSSILPFLHSFPHTPFFDTGAAPSGPPFTSFFHVDRICFFVCSLRSSEFTTWDQFPSKKKKSPVASHFHVACGQSIGRFTLESCPVPCARAMTIS